MVGISTNTIQKKFLTGADKNSEVNIDRNII